MDEIGDELITASRNAAERGASSIGDPAHVGAAVRAADGEIYTGSVVTTEDRHQSLHAERVAVTKAVTAHEDSNPIEAIAVNTMFAVDEDGTHARVCGSCLHFISEFSNGDIPVCIAHLTGERHTTLHSLYPEPWAKTSDDAEYS